MKTTHRSWYLQIAAFAVTLSFGASAYAETPREEVAHAYVLLKIAKSDYHGHKGEAIKQLELVGHDLGLDLHGGGSEHERQLKSDELLSEAGNMVHEARNKLEARDRDRAAAHLDKAIQEIDEALKAR
ncbi:MAG TPA: hypothetical protein VH597_06310 [Verrucomicrobiae bacterium]|jgi:hypothetical protein|nr:hypothetical protein [Verrucomicrobiae bacterium]